MRSPLSPLACLCALAAVAAAAPTYVGSAACAQCHRNISVPQSASNMANTWQGSSAPQLPPSYAREQNEANLDYRVRRTAPNRLDYRVTKPGSAPFDAPVETIVGGKRHGLSFLVRVPAIDGHKLPRAPLVEARYLHYSSTGKLVLSPGFPESAPTSWETAVGRVLSPDFETKCLGCHGAVHSDNHETGVRCESCHGPGSDHLQAIQTAAPNKAILNPKRLSNPERLQQCAQCHAGFGDLQDPIPGDLLISNQVNALRNSQCYIQSGAGLSCTTCHNPHHDAAHNETKPIQACLGCHSPAAKTRAALCPVNQTSDCLTCHMPEQTKGSFHMVDHWIRIHPEQQTPVPVHAATKRTQFRPTHLYLRMITAAGPAKAAAAHAELAAGIPFFSVAQKYSTDSAALSGGYLGDMSTADLDPDLAKAALALDPGQFSDVLEINDKPVIVSRLPRDFRYEAEQLEQQATQLREARKFEEAAAKYQAALQIYPRFLRALVFLGVTFGEQGNAPRGAAVLNYATQLYPNDPAAHYNLGIAYDALNRPADSIREYQRAIELQPDLIPAYLNLGSAYYSTRRLDEAADAYRRGLNQNPLTATLYYNLAQVYTDQHKTAEAKQASDLAAAIDPKFAKREATQ